MGRWLKKLNEIQESELTKLTDQPSVGYVSTTLEYFHGNNDKKIDMVKLVQNSLKGLNISPQQIIDELLSIEDEQDIVNGNVSTQLLRLHTELWLKVHILADVEHRFLRS